MKKITQMCVLMFLLFIGYTSKAQVASYTFTNQIGTFTPNSTSATNVSAVEADSGISATLPIGFNFVYGTSTYTNFFMSSNGFISLGSTGSTLTTNDLSATNATNRPIIAPLWDDLDGRATVNSNNVSKASYELTGTAPNRVLTVEWLNWEWNYASTDPVISFQVKLYETTNVIQFVYRQESGSINGTGSASIGINEATGSGNGSFLNLNTNLSTPTVTSTVSVTDISTKPSNNQVFTFTPPACLYKGTVSVTNINVPTATLNLSIPASTPMDFYVTEGTEPTSSTTPTGTIATGTSSLPLTGLFPSSIYTVYVKYACTALGSGWFNTTTFKTPCGVVGNFFEGFEKTDTGTSSNNTYPYCWDYIDTVTTSGYGYVSTSSARTGNNGYYAYRSSSTGAAYNGDVILISPETDNLGNGTKQIRFWAKASSSSYVTNHKFEVYRMDGITSSANKTLLQGNIPLTDSWQEFIIPLPVTTDDYFAFSFERSGGTAGVYLDDIYYEDLDTCLYPTGITITNITQTGADISWTASTSTSVTAYEYEVRSSGAPGSGTTGLGATGTTTNATTTSATVSGLNPSINYTVYVRSICGTSIGRWIPVPVSFYTLCGVITGNFFEGFENTAIGTSSNNTHPDCWDYIDTVTTSGYGYVNDGTAYAHSGNNGYYTYRTSTTGTSYDGDIFLISPETADLGNGSKQIRFWAKVSSSSYISTHKFEVYSMDGTTSSANKTLLQGNIPLTDTWQEFIIPLPVTTDDYFAFSFERNGGASYVYLDDIYYEDITPCIFPGNLTVTNITSTTATISWNASIATGVTSYEYEVRSSGAPGSGATGLEDSGSITAPATTKNIMGLTGNTNYTVYIRSVCGASPGIWTTYPVNFQTACATFGNFYEEFDATATGSSTNNTVPTCWAYIGATSGYYGYTSTDATRTSGGKGFRYYKTTATASDDLLLVSPPTDNLGNGSKQVRFWVKVVSGTANVPVYTLDGNTATATKTQIALIPVNTTWTEYTVVLPVTTDDYFAIGYLDNSSSTQLYLDDVYYEDVPPPTITDVNKTDVLCHGANTGEISVEVEGGVLPLTYDWTPAVSTTDSATGLAGGTYTVTVTDALNRTVTETVTINEPTAIVSNSIVTNISCNGANDGSITIAPTGGVGPYTYLWNTNDTGTALTGLSTGTYSVTITDASGCTLVEDVTITEPAVLDATGTQTDVSLYNGNDGEAVVTVTGGTSPYTYAWSPSGGTSDTASNLTAGTYTVVVTDANGCTTTEVFTITQPIPLMFQSVSQTNVSCNGGSDGTATVSVIGGNAPYTYLWTPTGGTSETATGLPAGVYNVEITDSTSNTITESFTITEPGVIVPTISNKKDVLCNGAKNGSATVTVTGGIAPFTYIWSNGTTTTNATVNNLDVGTYTVMITDANGCSSVTPATVTITQPAAIVINSANTTNVSCYGQNDGSVTVSVSGGVGPYTYTWSNGQSGTTISNLTKGNYTVTVTDVNNCSKTQTFTITEPAFVNAPVANNPNFCAGQNATLNDIVITGSNIKWYDAATGSNVLPATTALVNGTTYYATQTVGNCESARTPITVNIYQATPLTTTQLSVCSNTRIQNMTIDGFNYTQLKWYDSATSTTPLVSSQLLATQTYYISSVTGTCESSRQAVQVTVAATVPAPTASAQTVCSNTTLNDLVVTKDPNATLNWYSSTQSMIPLANTTVVTSGTYYVQQVIGNCESSRVAVAIQVTNVTTPSIASITTCEGITIGDLNIIGSTNYIWYTDNSTTTALPDTYVITSGTYYIANEFSGCISARKNVAVNVSARPGSPTGQTAQIFGPTKMVSDIKMDQPNVSWFGSYDDAVKQINEIPKTTQLQDQTYYGILTNANGCGSMPTAVEVTISLGVQELDLAQLSYYPNPADSELNISYIEEINKVEIFTITGQKVLVKEFKSNEVKVDLSGLSSGTYMVRIQTEKASQFIKIIKK